MTLEQVGTWEVYEFGEVEFDDDNPDDEGTPRSYFQAVLTIKGFDHELEGEFSTAGEAVEAVRRWAKGRPCSVSGPSGLIFRR